MTTDKKTTRFHTRGFTSLLTTCSFLVLAITGIVLYISPKGRVAHWTGWTVLGIDKEQWSDIHMIASLLFLISAAFHLYFNWRIFWGYIKKRLEASLNLKLEMLLALAITILCCIGVFLHWPPFSLIPDGRLALQDYWEQRSAPAPAPHAEEFTLTRLADQIGLPVETILKRLQDAGISDATALDKVGDLATRYNKTPDQLFDIVQPGRQGASGQGKGGKGNKKNGKGNQEGNQGGMQRQSNNPSRQGQGANTGRQSSQGGNRNSGMGYGRMTLEALCQQQGIPLDEGLSRLKTAGISAQPSDTLRTLASQSGKLPHDIVQLLQK